MYYLQPFKLIVTKMLNVNLNVWGEYIVFNILLGYTWAKNSEAHWTMYGVLTQWDTMQLLKKDGAAFCKLIWEDIPDLLLG